MPDTHDPLDPQRLLTLLGEQRGLYQRLRELSERQRTLITGDRPEMLLNILRERQSLVGGLARLNEQLAPFRRNWDGVYAALPEPLREQANQLLQEINGLLRVILRTDQEDTSILAARKHAVGEQIGQMSGGRSANTAYAQQASAAGAARAADVTG